VTAIPTLAAFLRRDWQIDISYRAAFALQILAAILTLALFYFLARLIDTPAFAAEQELRSGYFGYVAVGLAVFEIVQVSMASLSQKLLEEQTTGTLEALMVTPTSPKLIILSSAAYDLLRATAAGFVLIYGLEIHTDPLLALVALVALIGCIGLFASVGVAVAAFTVVFKRPGALLSLVALALGLLGGVYFPISVLPAPLEAIAEALPFTWALDVLRAALLGGDVDPLQLAGLLASAAILLPLGLVVFSTAVAHARHKGTLSQY
jgi:ABC-2 type transport system permease protein